MALNFPLFLDFDGVLHPEFCHESKHFCQLPVLEEALRAVPSVEIVISSTWRHHRPFEVLQATFSADIAPRVVGITPRYAELTEIPERLVAFSNCCDVSEIGATEPSVVVPSSDATILHGRGREVAQPRY